MSLAAYLDGPLCLFDVGARAGIDPRWERFRGDLNVLGFEPDAEECARLNAVADRPYRSRFLPYALGAEEGERTFNVARWPVASSIFEPNPDFLADFPEAEALLETVERRTLTVTPLDSVVEREGVRPDMLKVDVEGAELDVLRGGQGALAGSLVLDVEVEFVELFRGQPLFADVDTFLRERGWEMLNLRRVMWRRTRGLSPETPGDGGQLVSADALYVNAGARQSGLSRSQALKLAAILAAYRHVDYALALFHEYPLVALPAGERRDLERLLVPATSGATVRQDTHHF